MNNIIDLEYPYFDERIQVSSFDITAKNEVFGIDIDKIFKNNFYNVKNINIKTNNFFTINNTDLMHIVAIKINKKYNLNEIENLIIKTKCFEINLPFEILLNLSHIKYPDTLTNSNLYKKKDDFYLIKINDFIFSSDLGKFIFPMQEFNIIITSKKQIDITLISNTININCNLHNKQYYFMKNNFKIHKINNTKCYKLVYDKLKINGVFIVSDKLINNIDIYIDGIKLFYTYYLVDTTPKYIHYKNRHMYCIKFIDKFIDIKNIVFEFNNFISGSIYIFSIDKTYVGDIAIQHIKQLPINELTIVTNNFNTNAHDFVTNEFITIDKEYTTFCPKFIKFNKLYSLDDIYEFKIKAYSIEKLQWFIIKIPFESVINISRKYFDNDYNYIKLNCEIFLNNGHSIKNYIDYPVEFIIVSKLNIPYQIILKDSEQDSNIIIPSKSEFIDFQYLNLHPNFPLNKLNFRQFSDPLTNYSNEIYKYITYNVVTNKSIIVGENYIAFCPKIIKINKKYPFHDIYKFQIKINDRI